jgi:FlaA1/EpsC-like NDP-sugar epimerase
MGSLAVTGSNLRSPAAWDQETLDAYRDRVVLVTGAGGSIGSELCHKLSQLPISRLLLLDIDETAIFQLDRELECSPAERMAILGDVRNREFLTRVFQQHRPHIVLHAAAYKHVSVMEANPSAAVLNNVIGTRNVIDAVIEATCERFLFVSTDKAVEPASVMGATKRIAELLVQSRAAAYWKIRFACVRFGNVLGSRGSVVPIFQKQVEERKPITITDVRMTRYFITPEQATRLTPCLRDRPAAKSMFLNQSSQSELLI